MSGTAADHTLDEELASDPSQVRRVAVASAFGTGIELYDFLIFGLASGLVFPKLFFPSPTRWSAHSCRS
ncbi:hypothetical protein GCM10027418_20460 [Mariniluteicoccus endophyticus]